MNHNSTASGRLKGIYLRGKCFWYRYSHEGHQYRVSLDTESEGEAITKALKIRANPVLAGANLLSEEIKTYCKTKREDGVYTRNSADSREAVLKTWVLTRGLTEVRQIDEGQIKTWLKSLRKGKNRLMDSSVESYGMIIRGFCTWLVEERKLRENPASFIKYKRVNSAKSRVFCRREQVDELKRVKQSGMTLNWPPRFPPKCYAHFCRTFNAEGFKRMSGPVTGLTSRIESQRRWTAMNYFICTIIV